MKTVSDSLHDVSLVAKFEPAIASEDSELWKEIDWLRGALAAAHARNGVMVCDGPGRVAEDVSEARTATTATSGAPLAWPVSVPPQPPSAHESPSESILHRPTFHAKKFVLDSAV